MSREADYSKLEDKFIPNEIKKKRLYLIMSILT